jgi:hypothetical protein
MVGTPIRARRFLRVLNCALALLLVVAVHGLCTIAKVNWYLPQSNLGHYLTTATKMRVAHSSVALHTGTLQSVRKLVVSQHPEIAMFLDEWRETSVLRMLWTAILVHRSPPSESA